MATRPLRVRRTSADTLSLWVWRCKIDFAGRLLRRLRRIGGWPPSEAVSEAFGGGSLPTDTGPAAVHHVGSNRSSTATAPSPQAVRWVTHGFWAEFCSVALAGAAIAKSSSFLSAKRAPPRFYWRRLMK